MNEFTASLIAGLLSFLASLSASFSGGGSSLILFPLLLSFVPGTYVSLFIIAKISATVMSGVASFVHIGKKGKFDFKLFFWLLVPGFLGTVLGTYILQFHFNEDLFKWLLVVFIFFTAFYLLLSKELGLRPGDVKLSKKWLYFFTAIFSFFINVLNGIFGGVGIFITVFLVVFWKISFIRAVANTMPIYFILSLIQAVYLGAINGFSWNLGIAVTIGALFGGFIGTKLQYLKGNAWVKRAAVLVMFLIGIQMLI